MALLDQSGNFDALKMGVQMTLNELQKAFDATHIKEINPQAGEKLDPHYHQAMQAVVSEQRAEHHRQRDEKKATRYPTAYCVLRWLSWRKKKN